MIKLLRKIRKAKEEKAKKERLHQQFMQAKKWAEEI